MIKIFSNLSHKKKYYLTIIALLTLLLFFVKCLNSTSIQPHTTYKIVGNKKLKISLPYTQHNVPTSESYYYISEINHSFYKSTVIRIVPDDCLIKLTVNNSDVPIKHIKNRCNWRDGFSINLGSYLQHGTNILELEITNTWGASGLNITNINSFSNPYYKIILLLCLLIFLVFSFILLKYLDFDLPTRVIFLFGQLLYFFYLHQVDIFTNSYDIHPIDTGHLGYIKYIVKNLSLPNPSYGWEFHQPPLYYCLAAFVYYIVTITNLYDPIVSLQVFSLVIFFVFLIFGIKITNSLIHKKAMRYFVAILLVFWPSGIIHSVRLGNDVLSYLMFIMSLYYLLKWYRNQKKTFLISCLICALLTTVTKATGLIMFAVIGVSCIHNYFINKDLKKFLKTFFSTCLICLIGFSLNFADNLYFSMKKNHDNWQVTDLVNIKLNHLLLVNNDISNYIFFDIKTFFKEPYINGWSDKYGRKYFWNYFLKSSLFGEFFFVTKTNIFLSRLMSFLLLVMLLFTIVGVLTLYQKKKTTDIPMLFTIFISLAFIIFYRIVSKGSCNADFRFIYPILIPCVHFYGKSIMWLDSKNHSLLSIAGKIPLALFTISTICFYLIYYF